MSIELADQVARLDDLLEQYLHALDAYQTARAELSKTLSNGFFSLARANSSAPVGRRYGQDFYDYRMQASRQVKTSEEGLVSVHEIDHSLETTNADDVNNEKASETSQAVRDPINWYGVLVPQVLRTAQISFSEAVEIEVPSVLNATAKLRQLEIEIGRSRKSIKKLERSNVSNLQAVEIEGR